MDEAKRKALEEAGWVMGDAEDFLDLTPEERAEVERRCRIIASCGNVFADLGCEEPGREMAISDAFAEWYMGMPEHPPQAGKHMLDGFRAGFLAGMRHARDD